MCIRDRFYVRFGKTVHQIAAKPHKKRDADFNIIPEVQNILISFLLFRSGNRDLQVGQKMVHEKVTKKSGEHFLHGIGDTAVIHGLAKGVYIFIRYESLQCFQFFLIFPEKILFLFINTIQQRLICSGQQVPDIGDADSQLSIRRYFF